MQGGRLGTARVGVITIIEEEFAQARAVLACGNELSEGFYTDDTGTCDVVVCRAADRSNVPAEHRAQDLIEAFRPEVILVLGIAGGCAGRKRIALGDVVVAEYLHYHELRKLAGGRDTPIYVAYEHPSTDLRTKCVRPAMIDNTWRAALTVARPRERWPRAPKVLEGSIVAGEKIMGDPYHAEQRRLLRTFPEALAVEMESFGVARAIHDARTAVDYNPRLMIVRGISDLVYEKAPKDPKRNDAQRDRWRPYAACSAASFAKAAIAKILGIGDLRAELRKPVP